MDDFSDPTARLRDAAPQAPAAPLDDAIVVGAPDRRAPRLVRHGRVVRTAALAVPALAVVAVGALVVPGALAPRAPLFTAAAGAGGEAAAMSADSRIAMWVDTRYVAGAGLSQDGGRGTVYRLERTGDPESVIADAAAALGLDGDAVPSSFSSPDAPTWVLGPEDGTAPSLTLSWTGTGDWWYSDPAAYPAPVCTDVVPEGGTPDETYQECTQPEIPASESQAPDAAEAAELAAELFGATGFDVAASDIRVTADDYQTSATASLEVAGVRTALEYTVAWSPLGTIAWASGHSVQVVERGAFDTVSPVAAVDRIADGRWFGAAGVDYSGGLTFAMDAGVARDAGPAVSGPAATPEAAAPETTPAEPVPSTEPGASGGSDGSTGSGGTVDPAVPTDPAVDPVEPVDPSIEPVDPTLEPTPEPLPTPETVTVTLEDAEATLLLVWDADGNAWLVPGYAYQQPEQEYWTTVISLVDGVIALPEPIAIDPMIEPAPAELQQ